MKKELEKRRITANTVFRLAQFLELRLSFGLQSQYDIDVATDKLGDRLEQDSNVN